MKSYLLLVTMVLIFGPFSAMGQVISSNPPESQLAPGQNNPFWPVDKEHQNSFWTTITGVMATYKNGMCIHPTNASAKAVCDGLNTGAMNAFILDIIQNNGKHPLVKGQEENFGRGFYDGYTAAWAVANATFPKHNISNNSNSP